MSGAGGRTKARGFTAIEVLIAMTIMAIGAAAVMSMQKASIQGNLDARKTDVANAIAHTWVERLRRDAMQWTTQSTAANAGANTFANAKLLQNLNSGWFFPNAYMGANPETMSYGFDILGRDLPIGSVPAADFCVNVRLTTLTTDNLLIRADVRVLWPRGINTAPVGFCAVIDAGLEAGTDSTTYHAIYVTTAVGENWSPPPGP